MADKKANDFKMIQEGFNPDRLLDKLEKGLNNNDLTNQLDDVFIQIPVNTTNNFNNSRGNSTKK